MELRWLDDSGVRRCDLGELPAVRQRDDGFVWLDIPAWSSEAEQILAKEFGFHPMAVEAARD